MKKIFLIFLLIIPTSSCVVDSHNLSEWNKIPFKDRMKIVEDLDTRSNLFKDDKNTLYVGTWGTRKTLGKDGFDDHKIQNVAIRFCKEKFNLNKVVRMEKIVMTKEQTEKYKLYNQVYIKYICEKSDSQLIVEQKEDLKKQNFNLSKNTKTIRYTCSFSAIPSEKSRILIDGPKAYETTAIGVDIIYSNVNLTDKGAFTLQGASNDPGRAWFIGSQSFLILDTDMLPYSCN